MNNHLLYFLTEKYGNRVDEKKMFATTDNKTIEEELKKVENQIRNNWMMGIIWMIIGLLWLIISFFSLFSSSIDWYNIGKVILGLAYLVLGFFNFFQGSELKRKKVILETVLFVYKENS